MNTQTIAAICVICTVAVMVGGAKLIGYLRKKGVDVEVIEKKLDSCMQFAEKAADALEPFIPEPYSGLVQTITNCAAKTVQTTEDLTKAGLMTADQRKEAATKIITADLKSAGLPIDENIQKLISVAIDTAALLLPGHVSVPASNQTAATAVAASAKPTV